MNTPVHVAFSLAVLGRDEETTSRDWFLIAIGAILPDALLFPLFYVREAVNAPVYELLVRLADLANSVPLYLLLCILAWNSRLRWLWLLVSSALIHIAFDIPLHSDDAHRHFYPLTEWVFVSPVSFWDAAHFGQIVGVLEALLFAACFYMLWSKISSRVGKWCMAGFAVIYLFTFVHFLGHAFASTHWAIW